jgi:DNA-binding MarR family transcriptional regulator
LQKKEVIGNRRKHTLTMTAKGSTAFKKAHAVIEKELKEIFAVVPEKDRAKISQTFDSVLTTLIN